MLFTRAFLHGIFGAYKCVIFAFMRHLQTILLTYKLVLSMNRQTFYSHVSVVVNVMNRYTRDPARFPPLTCVLTNTVPSYQVHVTDGCIQTLKTGEGRDIESYLH